MTPADRFKKWVDGLAEAWKDRLRGWMASWVMNGIERSMDFLEPDLRAEIKPSLERLKTIPGLPDDFRVLIDKTIEEPKAIHLAAILPYLIGLMIGFGMGGAQPVMRWSSYLVEKMIHSYRLDPAIITRIWLRDKPSYEQLWQDLRDQGWTEERIAVAKELANIIPPLADMVRFADFSAFDPEVIAAFPKAWETPDEVREKFGLIGVFGDWVNRYWFSHWRQPGRYELGEMHRRGLIDDDAVKLAYRTMAYSEYWRDNLLDLVKEVPTRVDVRRFWDMRTIDEPRLREIYHAQGYYDKDLEDYVLWTKVYVAFPDLIARWKNGWITIDEVRSELTGLGMPTARVEEMIETKIKAAQPERTAEERDLTKTDITMAVKKEVISRSEGIELLMDLGYDETEAEYIIDARVTAAAGSPETFAEFKDLTQKYRLASGKEAKPMPEELKAAAAEVVKLTKEVESLEAALKEEEAKLIGEEVLPPEATAKRDELRVALHRAEAELARVQGEYDRLLAEYRHKPPG